MKFARKPELTLNALVTGPNTSAVNRWENGKTPVPYQREVDSEKFLNDMRLPLKVIFNKLELHV